jgi:hypothetical protein
LEVRVSSLSDEVEKTRKANLIEDAINRIDSDLKILRLKQSLKQHRARANWYEHIL